MIKKLNHWPSEEKRKIIFRLAVVGMLIAFPLIQILFSISNYPATVFESQLSFNGEIIKGHYSLMTNQDLFVYLIAQLADYGYMVVYGTLTFTGALTIARRYEEENLWRKAGNIAAILGIIAPICDSIENFLILMMLTDPLGFLNILAVIHSCFALIKWSCIFLALSWIILGSFVKFILKKQ